MLLSCRYGSDAKDKSGNAINARGVKQSILKQSLVIGVVIGVLTYNDI